MAERRMISRSIIETDVFMDMPMPTQCLYFHMLLRADDDGFITSPKRLIREIGCSEEDLKRLIDKYYIISFDSGVTVIRHWRIHNLIAKDRYKPSHCDELEQIELTAKKAYKLKNPVISRDAETCIQTDNKVYTDCIQPCIQTDNTGKVSIGKSSIDKSSIDIAAAAACVRANNIPDSKCQDADEDLGACLRLYENNIHPLTGEIERDKLLSLYDKYHREWVCEAIKEAAEYNGRSLKYIEGILTRWERDGFKTKKGDAYGRPQGGYRKSKKHLTPEEERAKWAKETPGWD